MTQTVTMEDGSIHNFPDEATPDMMTAALSGTADVGSVPKKAPEPSLMQRVGGDVQQRLDASKNATDLPNFMISSARIVPGAISDTMGEITKPITKPLMDITGISGLLQELAQSSAGMKTSEFLKAHPTVANSLGLGMDYAGSIIGSESPIMAARAAGGSMLPIADEGLKDVAALAVKHDIPLSVDQISSSPALKTAQKVSQEVPFSGQAAFRDSQMNAFNSALLGTVGQEGTKITPLKMRQAFTKVGKEFDDLGNGQTFHLGQDFQANVGQIMSDAEQTSTKDSIDNFQKALGNVFKNIDEGGNISGEKLNTLRSQVNALSRKANSQDTADLLHQLEGALIDTMTSGDPAKQAAFTATKQKYKNLLAIEPLAVKAKAGNINPTLLNDRVAKIYGRMHTTGQSGDIGELARIGHELLPQLMGSDTTQKAAFAALAAKTAGGIGAAMINLPATITGLAANRGLQGINRSQTLIKAMIKKGN